MIKKTVTYTDWNGNERTETFHFHYSQAELMEMEMSAEGGFQARVQRIIDAQDQSSLMKIVKEFVLDSYGVKSPDGKRFMKNPEIKQSFLESPAYSIIFMEMVMDDVVAAEFINGVVPDDMSAKVRELMAKGQATTN